jgi:hypothetical protein
MKSISLNNRLIVEIYKKEALKSEIRNGFATIAQKTCVKGLKVLVDGALDGVKIPTNSVVYIREESLHTKPWAQKPLESDNISVPFLIVDKNEIEYITFPESE